jgi:hypothetical protein
VGISTFFASFIQDRRGNRISDFGNAQLLFCPQNISVNRLRKRELLERMLLCPASMNIRIHKRLYRSTVEPGIMEKSPTNETGWVKAISNSGWILLVVGLVIAVIAHFHITKITAREKGRLTAQLDSTTRTATSNELQLAKLTRENLLLRSNLAALEATMHWRTISPTQEINLIRLLSPIAQQDLYLNLVRVAVSSDDEESRRYADRIAEVLTKCGFNVSRDRLMRIGARPPYTSGTGIEIHVASSQTPAYAAILNAFKHEKINFIPVQVQSTPSGRLEIWVLPKPE